jgi:inosine-uridine nucleoside N-ribohydrolase
MRLWIDTDIGDDPDDTVALWCAARHETTDIEGVSTVGGDTAWRADLAREVLGPSIDVVAGPPPPERVARADAYLSIGPWTHVADLAEQGALPPQVALMGGALGPVRHRGEVVRIEHNVGSDPVAARRVLSAVGGLVVVPLDATARLSATDDDEAALVAAVPRLGQQLHEWRETIGDVPLVLHDPATVLVLAEERVARAEARRLTVDDDGNMHAAMDAPVQSVVMFIDRGVVRTRIRALAEASGVR